MANKLLMTMMYVILKCQIFSQNAQKGNMQSWLPWRWYNGTFSVNEGEGAQRVWVSPGRLRCVELVIQILAVDPGHDLLHRPVLGGLSHNMDWGQSDLLHPLPMLSLQIQGTAQLRSNTRNNAVIIVTKWTKFRVCQVSTDFVLMPRGCSVWKQAI